MKLSQTTLAFLLAIQIAIVGVLLAARSGGVTAPDPFLSFDADSVDSVAVAGSDGAVRLLKEGETWQLDSGLPADAAKVRGVLDKLAGADGGWPVATSSRTAERFEVTEDSHQRRVTLAAGDDTIADVYLGTSPGYRKTHARHVDGDAVYAIGFSNFEAGVKAEDWLDKGLLRPSGTLSRIEREGDFALVRGEDDAWLSADGAALDAGKTAALAGRFTGLSVLGLSAGELPPTAEATYLLSDDEGVQTLSVHKLDGEDNDYAVTSDRQPGRAFELSSYTAEQMDVALLDLAPSATEQDDVDDGEAAASETEPVAPAARVTLEPAESEESGQLQGSESEGPDDAAESDGTDDLEGSR